MNKIERNRKELIRRYAVFTLSLFIIALGVSLITCSLIGTSPISSIPYVLSLHTPLSMGTFILLLNIVLIIGQMLMLGTEGIRRCRIELIMQLPVSILFGLFVDGTMLLLSFWAPQIYGIKLLSLLCGCCVMAAGISLEVLADVSMVSGEYFVHVTSQRFKQQFGNVKIGFDLTLVAVAMLCSWLMGQQIDGVREGTFIAAFLSGPLVKLITPRLKFVELWESSNSTATNEQKSQDIAPSQHLIITIAREYGSGGHEIGKQIAETLGIPFYDNAMIEMTATESGINEDTVRNLDQHLPHGLLYEMILQDYSSSIDGSISAEDALFVVQSRIIRKLAAQGSCVIVGRCSDYVLRDNPNCIHIYLHAEKAYKEHRAIAYYGIAPDKASAMVARTNAARQAHYAYYTSKRWDDIHNYHLVFDTSKVNANAICAAVVTLYSSRESAQSV